MKIASKMLDFGFMRLSCVRVLLVGLCAAIGAASAVAQTPPLAEVAKKEQERRKGQKTPAKVYTKKDLPPSPPAPAGAATQTPAAQPPAAEAKQAGARPEEDAKDETWWKNRINGAREELRRNEMFAEALQTRINSLSTDFVNRDDPYQRARIGTDRDKSLAELARVKADIELGKKKIEDIEEEARKAGVPPGWLR